MDLGVLTLLSMTGWTLLRNSTASSARKPKLSNAEGILELKRMHNNDMIVSPRQDAVDEEGNDRLSSLPDDVIRKIFSFISIKDAIGTSVLSTRWRFMWTSMPCLKFEIQPRQSEFIDNVLSRRNNQLQVSSVDLVLERLVDDDESVARILDYTFAHNVQQLSVTRSRGNVLECPYSFIATPTWDLPFLTTLHLHCVQFSDDDDGLFSKCINLKNLFLRRCGMKGTKVMEICHPRLSNLTLQHTEFDEVVNVVAPQLKNLNITWCRGKHLVNAPGLSSLVIEGFQPWKLSTPSGFHSLDNVDLFMYDPDKADAHEIVSVFQHFNSVKLLILNLGILKCLFSQRKSLSSSMERIPYKAFTFANAKILKFLTKARIKLHLEVGTQEKVSKRTEITPIAIFPMISCEEMTAMGDMASAQIFVEQLELFVEQCKADTNSDKVPAMCKPQVEMHWALELGRNLKEMMAVLEHRKFVPLETCLIMLRIKREYSGRLEEGTLPIMAWLKDMRSLFERIEQLITQDMCASKRAVMLLFFLRMCEDAAILTGKMLGWINAQQKKPLII